MQTFQTRSSNAIAKRFAWDAADGLYDAASRAVDHFVRGLAHAEEAGADKDDLALLRATMLDAVSTIQARIDRALDNEGLVAEQHQVDVTELVTP